MSEHDEEYLAVLKAAYDYEPQSEDEIAIKENQLVFLLEKTDDDWWRVKIKSESQDEESPTGLVPAAYVEQAEHTSLVKVLYDYDAAAPGELSIRENEILMVFDREDEWILVQSQRGGRAGFVPGNYVEESTDGAGPTPAPPTVSPPSSERPARPVSVYVDPADLVAQAPAKAQADDIRTWPVSEVDKKGKKRKGTLGIGNGAVFFASESDKTPVQKWQTANVEGVTVDKGKHIHIEVRGINPTKLHFNVGNKDTADAVIAKLDSSKGLSSAKSTGEDLDDSGSSTPPPQHVEVGSPSKKNGASVRFAEESQIIPPREPSEDGEVGVEEEVDVGIGANQEGDEEGEAAVALYDFEGTSSDELSVQEGERLHIIEKEGEEWWKCRNKGGVEGVVPASYLELLGGPSLTTESGEEDAATREEEKRLEGERHERERQARELEERAEEERRRVEQEQRVKAEKKRRENEQAAAEAEAKRKKRQEAARRAQVKAEREQSTSPPQTSQTKPSKETSPGLRASIESVRNGPPPESTRVWHDRSGQFKVEAALLGYNNGKLRLHKVNGVVIEVPSEKMSREDMQYVERLTAKTLSSASVPSAQRRVSNDDDDQPLAHKRREVAKQAERQPKKGPQIDWFEFFLSAGCDVDDCTRYASSFERDKIDEAILPDITESTMRSLGLREGDIIRVSKAIQQRFNKTRAVDQLASDEELARRLQEEENAKKPTSPAPNLFAGPGGVLKNNTQRRGRPQPSKSGPPPAVDLGAIGSASEQIRRNGSPLVRANSPAAVSPIQASQQSNSVLNTTPGFDDDAWTNRPGSKPPPTATTPPPTTAQRAPSAPPETQVPTTPTPPTASAPVQSQERATSALAKTDADIFDQLARLSQLKTNRTVPSPAPTSAPPATSNPVVVSPPSGYNNGLGMGPSPVPIGQHLQNQQTGLLPPPLQNGPRGPFAPVSANQSLLQPLIPTQTGFNNFIPTRPTNVSPFQSQPSPLFIQSQPTGFTGNSQPLISPPTGFPTSGPMITQSTSVSGGSFGNFTPTVPFPNSTGPPVPNNSTILSAFGQSPFSNAISTSSPVPSQSSLAQSSSSSGPNTSPANVFAQMKSGTFAVESERTEPQLAEKYDALRVQPQPTGLVPQATGWGFQQPNGGFHRGYTGY